MRGDSPLPLRLQRPLAFALVAAAAGITVVVSVVVVRARADERAGERADRAAMATSRTTANLASVLGGAAGLVDAGGNVSLPAFDAYAQDVVETSPVQALGLVLIVPDSQRAAVEREIGHPVTDRVGSGPAAHRPSYYVVGRVTPDAGVGSALTGVDLAMDPVRSAAIERAVATGKTVVSGPVASLPSGAPAFFVAKPLYRPGADGRPRLDQPVALVTVGFQGARVLQGIAEALPPGARIEVRDGGALLAATDPPPDGGTSRSLDVLGRRWSVAVDRPRGPAYGVVWLVALAGAAVVAAVGFVLMRGARYERRLRKGTEATSELADLSRDLAVATDAGDLAEAVRTHVPAIVGAELAGVAVVEPDEDRVRIISSPDIPPAVMAAFADTPLGAASPIATAAVTGEPVLLDDPAGISAAMSPEQAGALEAAGFGAVALLPLTVRGAVRALVGVAWTSARRHDADGEARLRSVREVCTRTLERIEASAAVVRRESGLAALARRLSTAETAREVAAAVFEEAGTATGATYANLGIVDAGGRALVIQVPSGLPDDVAVRYRHAALDAGIPLTDAALRNEVVWVEGPEAMAARYPAIVEDARRAGFAALVGLPLRDSAGAPVGAMGLAWSEPVVPDDALRSAVAVLGDMTAQTLERVRLADERDHEGELNRRLAALGELLANAGSTDEVMATLAAGAAAAVDAEDADVGIVDEERGILHLRDASPGGRTVALDDGPAADPAAAAVVAGATVIRRDLGRTVVAEPLGGHGARPLGALSVTFPAGHAVAATDTRAVSRLAELGGLALERATATDADRRRMARLARFSTELSAARSLDAVIDVVTGSAGLAVQADAVGVGLVDEGRQVLVMYERVPGAGDVVRSELALRPADADAVRDAVARRETLLVPDDEEWRRRYPGDAGLRAGDRSIAALPMRRAQGGRLGVVVATWRRPTEFDDRTAATLHLIARLAAAALQRAELHDLEHRLVDELQRRLVTDLPEVAGLSIASRYRAAGPGVEMGGDWFAGVALDGGRLGLVVGDMTGHGIGAVAGMAQIQATTAGLLRAGLDLGEVAEEASRFVADTASGLATALIAVIDPHAEVVRYVIAGQVPPIIVAPDGSAEVLDGVRRPLLGVARLTAEAEVVSRPFPPGSLLIAYTDGLIERRGEPIDDGIARLRRALAEGRSLSPSALADRLLVELLDPGADQFDDDVALVVVKAMGTPGSDRTEAAERPVGVPVGAAHLRSALR